MNSTQPHEENHNINNKNNTDDDDTNPTDDYVIITHDQVVPPINNNNNNKTQFTIINTRRFIVLLLTLTLITFRIFSLMTPTLPVLDAFACVFVDFSLIVTGGRFGWFNPIIDPSISPMLAISLNTKRLLEKYGMIYPFWVGNSSWIMVDSKLSILITTPSTHNNNNKLRPLIVYFHKGGATMGHAGERELIPHFVRQGYVVASVEYPLAPENPYPAAALAVEKSINYLLRTHSISVMQRIFHVDTNKNAIVGFSAGGNFAIVATRYAIAQNITVKNLMIVNGMLRNHDFNKIKQNKQTKYSSLLLFQDYPTLFLDDLQWFWAAYTSNNKIICDERCQPAIMKSFKGFPPTIIYVAEHDVLRDENIELSEQLKLNRIPCQVIQSPGTHWGNVLFDLFNLNRCLEEVRRYLL
jgi:acetyl esterase/lipase